MDFEISNWLWLIEIVAGLLAIYVGNWALKKIIHEHLETRKRWQVRLDRIVFVPLRLILWSVGIDYVFSVLSFHFHLVESTEFFSRARYISIVVALAWMTLRWKKELAAQLLAKGSHDHATLKTILKLTTAVVAILTILLVLHISGVNILPLLAFGGIGAAAVGFAAKDVIANFFGGLMIFITRPFTEGDEVYLYKDEIEGNVERIGWHSTIVRDKNKCPVYIPNSLFSRAFVVNRSRRSHRCIEETLTFRYEDAQQMPAITEAIRQMIEGHTEIDATLPLLIGVESLGDYAIEVHIKIYTTAVTDSHFTRVKQDVLLKINRLLEERNLEMPLPAQAITLLHNKQPNPEYTLT